MANSENQPENRSEAVGAWVVLELFALLGTFGSGIGVVDAVIDENLIQGIASSVGLLVLGHLSWRLGDAAARSVNPDC